jgi:hypothetical protein
MVTAALAIELVTLGETRVPGEVYGQRRDTSLGRWSYSAV